MWEFRGLYSRGYSHCNMGAPAVILFFEGNEYVAASIRIVFGLRLAQTIGKRAIAGGADKGLLIERSTNVKG